MDDQATTLTPEQQAEWRKVQQAKDTIIAWAKEMYDIDGDFVQVSEILDEWFGEIRAKPDQMGYVERVYEQLSKITEWRGHPVVWDFNMPMMDDWSGVNVDDDELQKACREFIAETYKRLSIDIDYFMLCLARYQNLDHPVVGWRNYDD